MKFHRNNEQDRAPAENRSMNQDYGIGNAKEYFIHHNPHPYPKPDQEVYGASTFHHHTGHTERVEVLSSTTTDEDAVAPWLLFFH
jgi:hypothetical protein